MRMRFGPGWAIGSAFASWTYRPMAYTWKKRRLRRPAPLSASSALPTLVLSSNLTPATSAAWSGKARSSSSNTLKAIFDPLRTERRPRAPRGVALHVDCYGIHGDVGGCRFHVHGERRGVPAQALWAYAEQVHRLRELLLEPRAFRVLAARAERPRGGDFREMHAEVGGAADAHAHDGGRAGLAA